MGAVCPLFYPGVFAIKGGVMIEKYLTHICVLLVWAVVAYLIEPKEG